MRTSVGRKPVVTFVAGLLLAATGLGFCSGCTPDNLLSFTVGYLAGRWEQSRVEIVTTERICYQDGVRVACP